MSLKITISNKTKAKAGEWVLSIILSLGAFMLLMPLIWGFSSSFRPDSEIFGTVSPFSLKSLIPENPTLDSYISLFTKRKYYMPIINTAFVCGMNILIGGVICSMAGYAFAKMRFKYKNVLFACVLFSIMIPFEAISIPLYSIINSLKWVDTYLALIVPGLAGGMVIFLFRQFFAELPDSLIESALIDGAKDIKIFTKIVIPLSKPVMISAGLIMFIHQWEAFIWPVLCARSKNMKMIQVALSDFRLEHQTYWSEMFAAAFIAAIIPVLLLLPLQKYYIRGISTSGMKE